MSSTWNKEKARAYQAAYRKANKDKARAATTAWIKANPDKARAHKAAWAKANPDKQRAAQAKWVIANREKTRAAATKWARANPEKTAALVARRRARLCAASVPLTPEEQAKVIGIYAEARALSEIIGIQYHVDHRIPLAKGGLHHPNNLQVLRGVDNLRKGAKLV